MKQLVESILDKDFDADDMIVDVPKLKNPAIFQRAIRNINQFNHHQFLNVALLQVKDAIQGFINNCKEHGFDVDDYGIGRSPIENHIYRGKLEEAHFLPVITFSEKQLKQFIKVVVDLDNVFAKHIPNYSRMTRDELYCPVDLPTFVEGRHDIVMFNMDGAEDIVNKLDGIKAGKTTLKKSAPFALEIYY